VAGKTREILPVVNHSLIRTIRVLAFVGLAILVFGIAHSAQVVQARPLSAPVASVSLSVPSQLRIGQDFSFTTTFANTSGEIGYGPIIDLILPTNGADGHGNTSLLLDGITLASAPTLAATSTLTATGVITTTK
jgi:hypothetical protein